MSFGSQWDGRVSISPASVFAVTPDLSGCEEFRYDYLIKIQDVTVQGSHYEKAVILWEIEATRPFRLLDFHGQESTLGITLPTSNETHGYAPTSFLVWARGRGSVAGGDVSEDSGELIDLWELRSIACEPREEILPISTSYSQLALGGGYECILFVSNKTNSLWEGTAMLRQGSSEPWASSWSLDGVDQSGSTGFGISLGPRATQKYVLKGSDQAQTGYLQMVTKTGPANAVAASFFYNFIQNDQLLDSTGTDGGEAKKKFWFPVEKTETANTGFAFAAGTESESFAITLTLFDEEGTQVGQQVSPYAGHMARFFAGPDGIFPSVPDGFVGALLVSSEHEIVLTVLRLEMTVGGFQLTSVPPADEDIVVAP
ncbi:MAG: hypothetical protein P8Z74_21445 [Acidobacteriota bacterium]